MRILTRVAPLTLGLLISGAVLANDNFGGSPLYNPRYSYSYAPYYYGGYPYYPAYGYAYGYPSYGWYTGTPYPYWEATHPYSSTNPNWIPYVGWR